MCGIFGAVSISTPFERMELDRFKSLTDVVSYRGPDSFGYQSYNWNGSHNTDSFQIFFGHRRLSILDLSDDGRQPMCFDNISIIFNGEIFNYVELREELQKEGVIFKTKSDTEVLIRLYARYGEKSFSKLNGMWAFILFDKNLNKIIASRDRFSIKPLFLYQQNERYYFASEIKQLLPLLPRQELNPATMYKFLLQSVTDHDDSTFFKHIKKLKPKTNFIIHLNESRISEEVYWDYEINNSSSDRNCFEEFNELLNDSIRIRLRSDVEIGTLLSGGLDSSAISVIANKIYPVNINTFSVVSRNEKYSEEKFVDILIREKNLKNTKIYIDENHILDHLDNTIKAQGEPFGSFSIIAQYMIFDLIKKNSNIKVVLSGQGGDEVLLGYRKFYFFYLMELFRRKNFGKFAAEVLLSIVNRTVMSQFQLNLATRYLPFLHNANRNFILLKGEKEPLWKFKNLSQRQQMDIDKYSVPNLSRFEDRNSMAHSIETRTPFLDHRLVNFAIGLDTSYKIKNGWTKYILRKSVSELPHKIAWRRDKRSFIIPEEKWLKFELRTEIESTFKNSRLGELGVIDPKKFLQYYNSFISGDKGINYSDLSSVYIAEKWCQLHF